jgi:4'-phosphopantetheinyl transferase
MSGPPAGARPVILRLAPLAGPSGDPWLERASDLLSPDETERLKRLRRPEARRAFAIGRLLARATLSETCAVEPHAWRFAPGAHGKPTIVRPRRIPPLRFNLSHSGAYCACAVAVGHDVGVDIESIERRVSFDGIARRCFSADERAALDRCPPEERRSRFFEHWTLKEALAKAVGRGLTLPFGGLSFHVGEATAVVFEGEFRDDPDAWRFFLVRPDASHRCAVAVRGRSATRVKLDWSPAPAP